MGYCGVEETQMSACRQCGKVWYCSPACKRADVKPHATVCRAYITVRRYTEERLEFAKKLDVEHVDSGEIPWRTVLNVERLPTAATAVRTRMLRNTGRCVRPTTLSTPTGRNTCWLEVRRWTSHENSYDKYVHSMIVFCSVGCVGVA